MDDLYDLLANPEYYSLSINTVAHTTGASVSLLKSNRLNNKFVRRYDDHINIFTFNGITYMGLQSQKIRYDDDAAAGTNWVEDAIKQGYYD